MIVLGETTMLSKTTGEPFICVKFFGHKREERSVRQMVACHGAGRDGNVDHIRFQIALRKPEVK